jgi:hypothetical protein
MLERDLVMTAVELDELCREEIEAAKARMIEYDERAALHRESIEAHTRGKTTTDFAIDALQRSERFCGEHDVARAWLRNYEPHAGIFRRERA